MLSFVGILGDIHGEDARLALALRFFARRGAEQVLAVGDVADGPGDLQKCVDLLREHNVATVLGNHDEWFLRGTNGTLSDAHAPGALNQDGRNWLNALPLTREFDTPNGPLLLCHGVGRDFMRNLKLDHFGYALESNEPLQEILRENRLRWMVNGHTHTRMVKSFGRLTNLNAGKVGDRRETGVEGGIWLADFSTRRAWLHFFDGAQVLEDGQEFELPWE
jgi:predicted phosphodiesterase